MIKVLRNGTTGNEKFKEISLSIIYDNEKVFMFQAYEHEEILIKFRDLLHENIIKLV